MDGVDISILRTIGMRPYGELPKDSRVFKPSFIAKKIGIEPKTVKARLKQMEKNGVICFYQVYPNFRHLNVRGAGYLFSIENEEQKLNAINRLEMVDRILEAHNFLGKELCIDLSYVNDFDLEKKLRLLSEFTGDFKPVPFYHRHMPPVDRVLSLLDWRILKALRYNALQPLGKVAVQLKVSKKTVKRRVERMAKEGSVFIVPCIDLSKAQGMLLFELLVYTNQKADNVTIKEILNATKNHYVYHYVPASNALGNFDMILFAQSAAEIGFLKKNVSKLQGVAKVDALLLQGWFDYTKWIDFAIDEQINALVQKRVA